MADVTLADYTGYIFLEIIKARQMADVHSAQLAKVYAQDEVLKHFSVPRFKIPRMELTIPVLISGAQFNQTLGFGLKDHEFFAFAFKVLHQAIDDLRAGLGAPEGAITARMSVQFAVAEGETGRGAPPDSAYGQTYAYWLELVAHPDVATSDARILRFWQGLFRAAITELRQQPVVKENALGFEQLFMKAPAALVEVLKKNVVIATTKVQSLLINPQTNDVKNNSSDATVFTIKAEMLEEGFFVRTVKDEATGQETSVVEFE